MGGEKLALSPRAWHKVSRAGNVGRQPRQRPIAYVKKALDTPACKHGEGQVHDKTGGQRVRLLAAPRMVLRNCPRQCL